MAFGFDQAISQITDGLGDLASSFGLTDVLSSGLAKEGQIYQEAVNKGVNDNLWTFTGQDWYKVFGYQFVVKYGNKLEKEILYTLPIPPQSLQIRMIPASQSTPTIGGVVEETGANVFWLVSLSGTTGIAVSRNTTGPKKRDTMAKQFRETVSTTGLLSGTLAGLNSAISKIGGAADALVDVGKSIANGDGAAALGGVVGAFNETFLPPMPYSASAVKDDTNGFTEIQELHRFLYTYSKLKGKAPSNYGLSFRCYKTNQEWEVIVQDFSIQQSASNPLLYRYSIALKGWNIKSAGGNTKEEFNRFGPGGDLQPVNLVTPEVFNSIKNNILKKI